MSGPAFSRSGHSNPYGKCTEDLKTKVPEKVKDDFAFVARFSETPVSGEHLRDVVVMQYLYGHVPDDMKLIIWEHVCNETESEYLRKLLYAAIFGQVHVHTVGDHASEIQAAKGTPILRGVELG